MVKDKSARLATIEQAAKILQDVAHYKYNLDTLFRDFVNASVLAIRNAIEPKNADWERREAEYLKIINSYDKSTIDAICQCLGNLIVMATQGFNDHLGRLYMALEIANKQRGQFFTPYEVSYLNASLLMPKNEIDDLIATKGRISLYEPACGAGGMIVAAAHVLTEMGYDPATHMEVYAQDIDRTCCLMTYLNCHLHHIPCRIAYGDALKMEEREVFITRALYLQHIRSRSMNKAA